MTQQNTTSAGNFRPMAQRIVNAEDRFIESVSRITGCSEDQAAKVMTFYLKNKIAKLDPIIGRISVKHGVFLEPDVLANALAETADPQDTPDIHYDVDY